MQEREIYFLKSIYKSYRAPEGSHFIPVLRGLDLSVVSRSAISIVGPSGSGKSTLLNIMGCLDVPDSGIFKIGSRDLKGFSQQRLAEIRNREIGFVFQGHHLLPQCTVLENVMVPTLAYKEGRFPLEDVERAKMLLVKVGLGGRFSHRPAQLSGGECQRVAVARALINRPNILLADEPTGSLDGDTSEKLGDLLIEVNREENVTLVVVTHSMELAKRIGKIYYLRDGVLDE